MQTKSYLKNIKQLTILFLICLVAHFSFGQSSLDSSFGVDGKFVDAAISNDWLEIKSSVIEQQDKILVGGFIDDVDGYFPRIFLRRYFPDGGVDGSFAWNGRLTFLKNSVTGGHIAFQNDGKFIVEGSEFDRNDVGDEHVMLCRFRPNGILDANFGNDGTTYANFGGFYASANAVAPKPDGKILITGYLQAKKRDKADHIALAQFLPNGSIDSSFGTMGSIFPTTPYEQTGIAMKLLPDNKILVAFEYPGSNIDTSLTCLVRYNANGKIDPSFGNNGIVLNNNPVYYYSASSIGLIVLNDGKILEYTNYRGKRILIRYKENGGLDRTFGHNGKVYLPFRYEYYNLSMAIQTDGKIVINAEPGFSVARYLSNGKPDLSFGTNGLMRTSFEGYNAPVCQNVLLQPDGKIVAIGHAQQDGLYYLALARFNNNCDNRVNTDDFVAIGQSNAVMLKWETASALHNNYFSVERSSDKTNFTEIGTVKINANAVCAQQYNFEDFSPATGTNYYRLKQPEKNGSFAYSKIIPVNFNKAPQFSIAPNPVTDVLHIRGLSTSATSKMYIIRAGSEALMLRSVSQPTYDWNVHNLPTGAYYLVVETNGTPASLKFIKK